MAVSWTLPRKYVILKFVFSETSFPHILLTPRLGVVQFLLTELLTPNLALVNGDYSYPSHRLISRHTKQARRSFQRMEDIWWKGFRFDRCRISCMEKWSEFKRSSQFRLKRGSTPMSRVVLLQSHPFYKAVLFGYCRIHITCLLNYVINSYFTNFSYNNFWPPHWCRVERVWLLTLRSRGRFPALTQF